MFYRILACVLLVGVLSHPALASSTDCPEQFFDGVAPNLDAKETEHVMQICFSKFAVLHSGDKRTPLWSAEHLTRERVEAAEGMVRKNPFHPEPKVPVDQRAELSDYYKSGYDRGHMVPNGDQPDVESQRDSFSLANMIPQNPRNNRGLWSRIESAVRSMATADGEVYVVTGPLFASTEETERLQGRVAIPTQIYKAVFDPSKKAGGVYLADNTGDTDWQVISFNELKALSGIDVFPDLPPAMKAHAMSLPEPKSRSYARPANDNAESSAAPTE